MRFTKSISTVNNSRRPAHISSEVKIIALGLNCDHVPVGPTIPIEGPVLPIAERLTDMMAMRSRSGINRAMMKQDTMKTSTQTMSIPMMSETCSSSRNSSFILIRSTPRVDQSAQLPACNLDGDEDPKDLDAPSG